MNNKIVTAIMRYPNGQRPATCYAFTRPGLFDCEEMTRIDSATYDALLTAGRDRVVAVDGISIGFDPDRPIEWDDVMPEGRGI